MNLSPARGEHHNKFRGFVEGGPFASERVSGPLRWVVWLWKVTVGGASTERVGGVVMDRVQVRFDRAEPQRRPAGAMGSSSKAAGVDRGGQGLLRDSVSVVIDLGDFANQPSCVWGHEAFGVRRFGSRPLYERMSRRLAEAVHVGTIHVTGSNIPPHVLTSGIANVELHSGPTMHLVERLCRVADVTESSWIAYASADRPFIDIDCVDRLIRSIDDSASATADYIAMVEADDKGGPGDAPREDDAAAVGLGVELIHADTLRRLRRNADRLADDGLGNLARCLSKAPGAYHLRFLPAAADECRAADRLVIRDEFDWDRMLEVADALPSPDASWREAARMIDRTSLTR